MKMHSIARLLLVAALCAPLAQVEAQVRTNVPGKIDSIMLDDNIIVIDGQSLVVREADLVVTYKGEPIRPSLLSQGFSVMYTTRADGSLSSLTLIGPTAKLDALNQH